MFQLLQTRQILSPEEHFSKVALEFPVMRGFIGVEIFAYIRANET